MFDCFGLVCISCIIVLLEMVIKLLGLVWDFQIRGFCRKLRMDEASECY